MHHNPQEFQLSYYCIITILGKIHFFKRTHNDNRWGFFVVILCRCCFISIVFLSLFRFVSFCSQNSLRLAQRKRTKLKATIIIIIPLAHISQCGMCEVSTKKISTARYIAELKLIATTKAAHWSVSLLYDQNYRSYLKKKRWLELQSSECRY